MLSGLLVWECSGSYTIVGKDRYGCVTRRSEGTCSNGGMAAELVGDLAAILSMCAEAQNGKSPSRLSPGGGLVGCEEAICKARRLCASVSLWFTFLPATARR